MLPFIISFNIGFAVYGLLAHGPAALIALNVGAASYLLLIAREDA